jgi:apolipoprotein N-acyltransferase
MQMNPILYEHLAPLSIMRRWLYVIVAFILVAFGQPAWVPIFGLIAACIGYALFWRVLLCFPVASQRFWYAFIWFFAVQLIQLSWFISHPYLYIYAVYLFVASLFGTQFGIIGLFINKKMISSIWRIITLASLWTIFEWSRLFILSGFSFNPTGIALGGNLYSMQLASIFGIFGLSFLVFITNLLAVRAWILPQKFCSVAIWLATAFVPYIFGAVHLHKHEQIKNQQSGESSSTFNAVLVQTAFPVEESIAFDNKQNMISYVREEWRKILNITKKHLGKPINLVALPEFVVPFGTYANIYHYEEVVGIFREEFGKEYLNALPLPEWPLGGIVLHNNDEKLMVNNAFWVQAIANVFNAGVIAGLEDAEDLPNNEREYYSAAILFQPQSLQEKHPQAIKEREHYCERYEKRVLVPMGEYIPFTFCKELAQQYGVFGSFTAGTQAKVMQCGHIKISPSICYEETFGDLVREGREMGADLLVNLTSDVWYPNSRLPMQHLEHARFRTVENGVPLIRACNTGITSAIDSLGRSVAVLGGDSPEKAEWVADALYVQVPTYSYSTLYSQFGDKLIIRLSLLVILISCLFRKFSFNNKV